MIKADQLNTEIQGLRKQYHEGYTTKTVPQLAKIHEKIKAKMKERDALLKKAK